MIWKCAGKRFTDWESFIRFYYEAMPEMAEWLIEQKRKSQNEGLQSRNLGN